MDDFWTILARLSDSLGLLALFASVSLSIFDDWIPVKLYHKPTPAPPYLYEYWTPFL